MTAVPMTQLQKARRFAEWLARAGDIDITALSDVQLLAVFALIHAELGTAGMAAVSNENFWPRIGEAIKAALEEMKRRGDLAAVDAAPRTPTHLNEQVSSQGPAARYRASEAYRPRGSEAEPRKARSRHARKTNHSLDRRKAPTC